MELTICEPPDLEVWLQQRYDQFSQMPLQNPENIFAGVYHDHLKRTTKFQSCPKDNRSWMFPLNKQVSWVNLIPSGGNSVQKVEGRSFANFRQICFDFS